MKATDDLFLLIKSLTKAEKRHFTLYALRHSGEENQYVKLFNSIDKQEKYDESKIKNLFKEDKLSNNFRVAKKYLYDILLESLAVFHKTSSVNRELKTLLIQVEVLNEKGLFEQCRKLLEKAKELAYKRENYFIINDILELEYNILVAGRFSKISEEELRVFFDNKIKNIEIVKNISEYEHLSARMFSLYLQGGEMRDKETLGKFKKIMDEPLLRDEKGALSFFAEALRLNTSVVYYEKVGDYENSHKCAEKIVALFEERPFFINKRMNSYLSALSNLFVLQKGLKKYDECRRTIEKFNSVTPPSKKAEITLFINSGQAQLNLYNDTGSFEEGLAAIPAIEAKLREYAGSISKSDEMVFYFNIAHICFGAGKYGDSLNYINKIINNETYARFDILYYSWLLQLIIHFELNNTEYLPYLIKHTYRFLLNHKKLYELEAIILKFLRRASNTPNNDTLLFEFSKLKTQLIHLKERPGERTMFEAFDLVCWLDSKIKRIPFKEAVLQNSK